MRGKQCGVNMHERSSENIDFFLENHFNADKIVSVVLTLQSSVEADRSIARLTQTACSIESSPATLSIVRSSLSIS